MVKASHKLVDFQGKVLLQRKQAEGWTAPQPVLRRGLSLVSADRLEVGTGSEALVRCASRGNRLWSVEPGATFPVSRGCGVDELLRLARRTAGLPGGGDPRLPYLIEPRATTVLGGDVPVRWNPVAGVSGYQVWLVRPRDRRLLWGTHVSGRADTLLPATLNLTPGEPLLVVVEAEDGSSSQLDAGAAGLAFRRATAREEQALAQQRAALPPLGRLNPEAALLVQVDVLRQNGLQAAALRLLEAANPPGAGSLSGVMELAELYGAVGLNGLAAQRWNEASQLAGAAGDAEALAEARTGAALAGERLREGQL